MPGPVNGNRVLALVSVGSIVYLALFVALLPFDGLATLRSDVLYNLAAPVAAMLAVRAAVRASGRMRWAWAGLAFTAATWGLADIGYSIGARLVSEETLAGPNALDALYYAGYLSFMTAVPVLSLRRVEKRDWRSGVDALAIVVVSGTLAWHTLLSPTFEANEGNLSTALVAAGYPLLDLGLLAMVLAVAYRRTQGASPLFFALGGSALAALCADSVYTYLLVEGLPGSSALEVGWLLSYCLIGIGATIPQTAQRRTIHLALPRHDWVGAGLPYLALLPLSLLTFGRAASAGAPLDLLAGSAIAYTVVIGRQWLTIVENLRLQRELAAETARTRAAMEELATKAAELERLRAEAEFLAEHDGLTGLLNHRAWFTKGPALRPTAVALFDIDNFKSINDNHGHPAGDVILRELAVRLRDLLPSAVILGRLGGEEFGVLFGGSVERAARECQAAVRTLGRTPLRLPAGVEVLVTMSAGVAPCDMTGDPVHDLLSAYERSDALLYRAKAAGRNRLESESDLAASA